MNGLNTYLMMMLFTRGLDEKTFQIWNDEIGEIGYHITIWNKVENVTIHFYYDNKGKQTTYEKILKEIAKKA